MSRLVVVRVPGWSKARDDAAASARWLTASFTMDGSRAHRVERGGTLRSIALADDSDLLLAAFRAACAAASVAPPDDLRCRVVSEIPVGVGEGASAAAVVAGVAGARAVLGLAMSDAEAERIAGALEPASEQVRAAMSAHTCAVHPVCDGAPTAV